MADRVNGIRGGETDFPPRKCSEDGDNSNGGPFETGDQCASRQAGRLGRVCSSWMMVMQKYSEAVSQERVVGNGSIKELFLHVTRQVRPQLKCCVT